MTSIALEHTYHTDIISVPDEIGAKIKKYQNLFDKWLYDKDNDHGNWISKEGQKYAVAIDTETFVNYLNDIHLRTSSEKAAIIQKHADDIALEIPRIYF